MSTHATPRRRTRRGITVATAGVLVVAAASSASAAGVSAPAFYAGNGNAAVVQIRLNLPAAAPGLPSLPGLDLSKPIDIGLIDATGTITHDGITKAAPVASTTAELDSGTLFTQGGLLNSLYRAAHADQGKPGPDTSNLFSLPANPAVSLTVGSLDSRVSKTISGQGSDSELVSAKIAPLTALLPAGALDSLSSSLDSALNQGSDSLSGAVDTAISAINGALSTTPVGSQTSSTLKTLQDQLNALKNKLPGLAKAVSDSSTVSLEGLHATESVSAVGDKVVGTAQAKLAYLSVLGGLVTLKGFDNSVTATAGGTAGSATANAVPNVAEVEVGPGLLGVILGPDGLAVDLAGSGLPSQVTDGINQVVTALNGVLGAAGVAIKPATYTKSASADGSAASAASTGLEIVVNSPTNMANTDPDKALVHVVIGRASTAVEAAVTPNTPHHNPRPVHHGSTPPVVTRHLAHTGAELPLTGAAALALLGAGAVVRRRRSAVDAD